MTLGSTADRAVWQCGARTGARRSGRRRCAFIPRVDTDADRGARQHSTNSCQAHPAQGRGELDNRRPGRGQSPVGDDDPAVGVEAGLGARWPPCSRGRPELEHGQGRAGQGPAWRRCRRTRRRQPGRGRRTAPPTHQASRHPRRHIGVAADRLRGQDAQPIVQPPQAIEVLALEREVHRDRRCEQPAALAVGPC